MRERSGPRISASRRRRADENGVQTVGHQATVARIQAQAGPRLFQSVTQIIFVSNKVECSRSAPYPRGPCQITRRVEASSAAAAI